MKHQVYLILLSIITLLLVRPSQQQLEQNKEEIRSRIHETQTFLSEYAYNVSSETLEIVKKFHLNVLCGSFDHDLEIQRLFESLLNGISNSLITRNIFRNSIEAETVKDTEYLSESLKDGLMMSTNEADFDNCRKEDRVRVNENDVRVKFSHHVVNIIESIKSMNYEVYERVLRSDNKDLMSDFFEIESNAILISSQFLNEFYTFLTVIKENRFHISETELKVVRLLDELLRHSDSSFNKKPLQPEDKKETISLLPAETFKMFGSNQSEMTIESAITTSKAVKEGSRLLKNMFIEFSKYKLWASAENLPNIFDSARLVTEASNDLLQLLRNDTSLVSEYEKMVLNKFIKISAINNDLYDGVLNLKEIDTDKSVAKDFWRISKAVSDIASKIVEMLEELSRTYDDYTAESVKRFVKFLPNVTEKLSSFVMLLDSKMQTSDEEIQKEEQRLLEEVSNFIPTEERRKGLHDNRMIAGQYAINISSEIANLGKKLHSNLLNNFSTSDFNTSLSSVITQLGNEISIILQFQLTLTADEVLLARYCSNIAKKVFSTIKPVGEIGMEQKDSIDNSSNENSISENQIQIDLSHQVVNALSAIESLIYKTKRNVKSYMGTVDILYFEATCISILYQVMNDLKSSLQSIKAKEFQIVRTDLEVVEFISATLQKLSDYCP